jgi:hypothetical protein
LALFSLLNAYQAPRTLPERISKLIQVVCSYAQVLDGVIDLRDSDADLKLVVPFPEWDDFSASFR